MNAIYEEIKRQNELEQKQAQESFKKECQEMYIKVKRNRERFKNNNDEMLRNEIKEWKESESTNKKRTDIHAPSKINPDDYELIAALVYNASIDGCMYLMQQRNILDKHMKITKGNFSNHEHGGDCHICGAYMKHTAVFYHEKTNSYIKTGFDCAAKLDMGDEKIFRRCKTEYEALRRAKAGIKKARALLSENDLLEFADTLYEKELSLSNRLLVHQDKSAHADLKYYIEIFDNIIDKLIRYGSLSDKQWAFLKKLKNDIINFESNQKKRAQEQEQELVAIPDAPEGRHIITGTILSLKWVDNFYGPEILKWLIKTDEGYKVWSSVPTNLYSQVNREDKVTFNVTLTPSDNDPKFAYGKRPAKAKILN